MFNLEGKKYIDILKKAGLLFTCHRDLIVFLCKGNFQKWWMSNEVKSALQILKTDYYHASGNFIKIWKNYLIKNSI